ncbi:hypothetical protein GCM10010372_81520 [Streptomyces tauricus]|nr:hypothetical protein GCM10010372_81520 [Streptomyces tauricus]
MAVPRPVADDGILTVRRWHRCAGGYEGRARRACHFLGRPGGALAAGNGGLEWDVGADDHYSGSDRGPPPGISPSRQQQVVEEQGEYGLGAEPGPGVAE